MKRCLSCLQLTSESLFCLLPPRLLDALSKLLADTVTVHHGHMPEIALTSATTATGIWAMFDWVDWSKTATPERTFQGYGHYNEEYEKGADGRWRIKRLHLTRLRVDHPTPQP